MITDRTYWRGVVAASFLAIIITGLLAGCKERDSGAMAAQRYDLVRDSGNMQERCFAAREVARLYLDELDQPEYEFWRLRASIDCMLADQNIAL